MLRPTRYALLAWLGMLSPAAAQADPAPLTPPGYDGGPDSVPPVRSAPLPTPRQPLPHYHALPPQPVALPPADGPWQYVPPTAEEVPPPVACSTSGSSDELAQHLLKAAEHLEAAGMTERAARLRGEARQRSLAPLLAAKLAQLKSLQAEIDQLKQATGGERMVAFKLKIAEVSREKVIECRGDINPEGAISSLVQFSPASGKKAVPVVVTPDDEDFYGLERDWAALKEARAVSVLSAPSLTTISGQPATCIVGGLRPMAVPAGKDQTAIELKHLGISVEITPHVLSDKRLRLELQCRTDALDGSRDRKIGGQIVPGVRIREIDAAVEMTIGQTAVLACIEEDDQRGSEVRQTSATTKTKAKDDNVTLILVTPTEIGEKTERVLPRPVAENPGTSWWDRWWRK